MEMKRMEPSFTAPNGSNHHFSPSLSARLNAPLMLNRRALNVKIEELDNARKETNQMPPTFLLPGSDAA